ncbi:MAG: T9SS type A sorting domain-containing protein [Altibacter sp.]|nr:T9SS type A sorting domain-containing protein [Altibacter sp.]
MRKFIILLTFISGLYGGSIYSQSQLTFKGSEDYGRMYNIIFHPTIENRLFAITLGNHIMQSNDKGLSWEILYSYPNNGVHLQRLELLSNNTLTFSVQYNENLSENAVFFYDLSLGEITRQYSPPITNGSDKVWIDSYAIFENNHDIAMVHQAYRIGLTGYAKVYYTMDGGASWNMIYYNVDYNGVFPNNVAISPDNSNKLFIARGAGPNNEEGGLFISQDSGNTWLEKIPDNNYNIITFHPQDANNILLGTFIGNEANGHVENLYRSLDGGTTWNVIPISWEEGTLDNITGIVYNPLDHNNILLMEENEVVITFDDWATHEKTTYPLDNLEGYYYGVHAAFSPFQNGELFVNADYYPLFSQDAGTTFNRLYNRFYPCGVVGLQEGTDDHLFHSVQRGLIHLNLTTGFEQQFGVEPVNLVFNSDAPIYMVDKIIPGRIYKYESSFIGSSLQVSNDFGSSYTVLHTNFFDQLINLTSDPNDANVIWAVFLNEGGLVIDFNDMNNPQVSSVTLPENDILTDVFIDDLDSNIVFITVGAHVYRSVDGGQTWEDSSTGLGIDPATDIIFDIERNPHNNNEYLITASDGIYRSTNDAASWEQVYITTNVRKVHYSPLNASHAVATIPSGNGVESQIVYTLDGGETWEALPFEAIAHVGSGSMAYKFHEQSVDAYIGSYDLGVVKYTIDLATLGTPELPLKNAPFIIYPNPAESVINFREQGETFVWVSVFNNLGQEIISNSYHQQLDISTLEKGVYFVRVKNSEGEYFIKSIIKK